MTPSAPEGADRPLIGVTTSEVRLADQHQQTPEGEPPRPEMALGLSYLRAIEAAGGLPVVIPPLPREAVAPLVRQFAGVCFSGGPDIDPSAYGSDPDPNLGPTWRDIDLAELAVVREADALRMPILAICRGAQALNVSRRGTLFQHLPERFGDSVLHRQPGHGPKPAHAVTIEPGTLLASVMGATTIEVNSYHHQAANDLGRGLRAVAWSPDGVVEAIEAPASDFVLGVQWHAESMVETPGHERVFPAFVTAAQGYREARATRVAAA